MVDAFRDLSCMKSFWLGLAFPGCNPALGRQGHFRTFKLDPAVVDLLVQNFEELNALRADAQGEAEREYGEIRGKVALLASAQA